MNMRINSWWNSLDYHNKENVKEVVIKLNSSKNLSGQNIVDVPQWGQSKKINNVIIGLSNLSIVTSCSEDKLHVKLNEGFDYLFLLASKEEQVKKKDLIDELVVKIKFGKKEKKLLIALKDFKPHKVSDLEEKVKTKDIKSLKRNLAGKLKNTEFVIASTGKGSFTMESTYQLKNITEN